MLAIERTLGAVFGLELNERVSIGIYRVVGIPLAGILARVVHRHVNLHDRAVVREHFANVFLNDIELEVLDVELCLVELGGAREIGRCLIAHSNIIIN